MDKPIMAQSIYRFFIGVLLLIFLYFELDAFMWGLIAVLLLEGITNLRISRRITRLRNVFGLPGKVEAATVAATCPHPGFDSERMMSLLVGLMLLVSYFLLNYLLWFLPWFLVIALIGSGASGFCPMLIALRRLGFK
jgi:hypothetical protein